MMSNMLLSNPFRTALRFWLPFTLILVFTAFTRFWGLERFSYAVFDEVYYASFASRYIGGTANFWEAHPPTGKLIYATVGAVAGAPPDKEFVVNDSVQPFGSFPYIPLRATAAAAGTLLVGVLMLLGRELTKSPTIGLIVGFLAAVENSLVLESRYVLLNIFLLLFGATGLLFFLMKDRFRKGSGAWYAAITAASLFLGLAGSVKINGFVFLLVAWFFTQTVSGRARELSLAQSLIFLLFVPFAVFFGSIGFHFALFPPTSPVVAFFGPTEIEFISSLRTRIPALMPGTALDAVAVRLAEIMLGGLLTLSIHFGPMGHHPSASPWYSWPLLWRGIPFVSEGEAPLFRHVIWLGNPLVWWGGLALLFAAFVKRFKKNISDAVDPLILGYLVNLLALSIAPRELFVYLYLPSLVFLILIMGMALERLVHTRPMLIGGALFLVFVAFLFFLPLTYGLPLSETGIRIREWLPGWKTF